MSKKKVINPICLYIDFNVRLREIYCKKITRGGAYSVSENIATYIRDWNRIIPYCNTQGLRICLKIK